MLMPARFRGIHGGHRGDFFVELRMRTMGAGLELFGLDKNAVNFRWRSAKSMASGGKLDIGIPGMQERIRQFGATLEIHSGAEGTKVVAKLPAARIRSEVVA